MSFRIPHEIIKGLLPDGSQAQNDWVGLVDRADDLVMDRDRNYAGNTLGNDFADEYEGTWLNRWTREDLGQRLYPNEIALVPLFHELTRPLSEIERARASREFEPVLWKKVEGEHKGVDLQQLARRIAATTLESLDGDSTKLAFEALADAHQALTPREIEALNVILSKYFARDAKLLAFGDEPKGVSASFEAIERPHALRVESRHRATYSFKREVRALTVNAPAGSKVSIVPRNVGDQWIGPAMQANVGSGGKVSFDLSKIPSETASIALYVVGSDGGRAKMPTVKARASIPLPRSTFDLTIDNSERIARLRAGMNGST
jgi:hypothetical protein